MKEIEEIMQVWYSAEGIRLYNKVGLAQTKMDNFLIFGEIFELFVFREFLIKFDWKWVSKQLRPNLFI